MTREEAVKILKQYQGYEPIGGERRRHFFDLTDEVVDVLLAALAQPAGWVSVEERMPFAEFGESDSVLGVTEMGTPHVVYFDGGCWCYPTGETFPRRVTHWMPLPAPPEKEESK